MANEHTGDRVVYGVSLEGTRMTAEAAVDQWLQRVSGVVQDKAPKDTVEAAMGTIISDALSMVVEEHSEGDLLCILDDTSPGYFFASFFGAAPSVTAVAGETLVKDHIFAVVEDNLPALVTVFKKDALATTKYAGCLVTGIEIDIAKDKIPLIKYTLRGLKGAADTDTVTLTEQKYFSPGDFTFKLATNQAGLDAAAEVVITGGKITLKREYLEQTNDGVPQLIGGGKISGTMDVNILYNATTYHDLAHGNTDKAARMSFVSPVTIGSAVHPEVEFDFYKASIEDFGSVEDINGWVEQSISCKMRYSLSDAKGVRARLRNLKVTAFGA